MTKVHASEEPIGLNWYGYLTMENLDAVGEAIKELLEGKRFAFISANARFFFRPEVKTSLKLTGVNVYRYPSHGSITVEDAGNIWSLTTSLKEGDDLDVRRTVHLSFEPNKLNMELYTGDGRRLYWVAALEKSG